MHVQKATLIKAEDERGGLSASAKPSHLAPRLGFLVFLVAGSYPGAARLQVCLSRGQPASLW